MKEAAVVSPERESELLLFSTSSTSLAPSLFLSLAAVLSPLSEVSLHSAHTVAHTYAYGESQLELSWRSSGTTPLHPSEAPRRGERGRGRRNGDWRMGERVGNDMQSDRSVGQG